MNSVQVGTSFEKATKEISRFMTRIFAIGILVAIVSAVVYWKLTPAHDDKIFHCIMIVGALGYSIPAFTCVIRLSMKGYYLGVEQAERLSYAVDGLKSAQEKAPNLLENVKAIMDKAVPIMDKTVSISNNVEEIVTRAKGMADDVEAITHKVRLTMESLNGHLDVRNLEAHLKEAKQSLKTIADVFTGGQPASLSMEFEVPAVGKKKS